MAWRSHGESNETLVEHLFKNGLIKDERVKNAMLGVDRAHYSPSNAYRDSPQSIGYQATISAPHMHASAAEGLLPYLKPGSKVLDVGSGSGYLSHVLLNLVQPGGKVVGIDHIQPLVDLSIANVSKSVEGKNALDSGVLKLVKGDGRLGHADDGPYDAIHVGAAAKDFHEALIEQLNSPGRMFIPVEEHGEQHIYLVDKDQNGKVIKLKQYAVRYVPLTDAPKV